MKFTPPKVNRFLLVKLPSAYFTGVRLKTIDDTKAVTTVKHRWINQNPFKSMYFAIQCMASELSTGVLVLKKIHDSGKRISMLVTEQKGSYTKKARGRIQFICEDGDKIDQAIQETLKTGEGQTIELHSVGIDEEGDQVASFTYQWGIKLKG
ncbi:MAG: DUF4442 domain-containing protein [Flavobacteriales bacterium]